MSDNLTTKILRAHFASGELSPGRDVTVSVDQVLLEDATGTMTAMQFEMLGVDSVAVPLAVTYVDHNVLQIDDKNMQDHQYLRTFSARYGLHYSPAGHGISHYIHLEKYARPGGVLVGADSHSSMAGAVGMFAAGAGGLEVAVAMAGFGFDFVCPEVVGVELRGRLVGAASAKDIVLELLRRHDVRGGRGKVFEFFGDAVAGLSTSARGTICNMIVETGATTAIFPSDSETRRWLVEQGREADFQELTADDGAAYNSVESIELGALVPLIAIPHSPGNVKTVAETSGVELSQVCVGSSVNSSYEDLATVAAILKGQQIHPRIQLTVTPGSRQILQTIIASGVYDDLLQAGARMLEPICGPCVGIGQAPLGNEASLRTFNRNFPGRSGTAEDMVYLCSPATAAASALTGVITDPSAVGIQSLRPAVHAGMDIHSIHISAPLPEARRTAIEIIRGSNLVPPPVPGPLPPTIDARVLTVVGDDVSTGDMAPDGAIAMSVWSNIKACAAFMFRRVDPGFHDRAREWDGGVIVGGENYGQGSSREHAALVPLYLGIRVIAARSYARIHRRNLIAVGIVPLLIPPSARSTPGEHWVIEGLADAITSSATEVTALVGGGGSLQLGLDLSPSERSVLASGGLLAHILNGARPGVASAHPAELTEAS
ncbi:aconitate hydratase [Paeniglutamicibacter gangotriensis]|uniref:Isopropylmalate isomerase large subunit n=1 Tax=Paeniglutamicibacter gangotriensis Lz1y TaxID=1276920 RepID=M7MP45_9MICC|nr:aconitate hydratase [Paeniglutamicibacter gangotriensis]EMQ96710.1 isopropylmalate isomerase large subunit [Paeniglutamicibacter gangotriensis Lz1y]